MEAGLPAESSQAGLEVLTIGETMLLVTPEDGLPLSPNSRCLLRPAGAESNVAMQLAALGHRVGWASRLGNDPLGTLVLEGIARSGVDVSAVERTTDPTGVFFKNPGTVGTTVHYYRAGSAASTMDATFLLSLSAAAHLPVVHITGITPALSSGCRELVDALLVRRVLGDALVSFDVNFRPVLWGPEAPDALLGYARLADITFVGRDEAEVLWGTKTAADIRTLIGSEPQLVVKDADQEAVSFTPRGETHEPALPIEVVEPVGAGDAFAAGWLAGLLRGLDDATRLRLGHKVAASVLVSTSDHGVLPPAAELRRLFDITPEEWDRRVDVREDRT